MELGTMSTSQTANNPMQKQNVDLKKESDYSKYHSTSSRLNAWMKINRAKSQLDPRAAVETFMDKGVLRYANTWLPVVDNDALEAQNNPNSKSNTGCVQFPLDTKIDIASDQSSSDKKGDYVRFLLDWQKLWRYLENDNMDELAIYCSLLRVYIEFFFHKKMAMFVVFLYFYSLIVLITVDYYYNVNTIGSVSIQAVLTLIEMIIYLALRKLYKGSILGDDHTIDHDLDEKQEELLRKSHAAMHDTSPSSRIQKDKALQYLHNLQFRPTFTKFFRKTFSEAWGLITWRTLIPPGTHKTLSYYNLLNISLKFLTRHNGITIKETNFNRMQYRICLLLIVFFMPFYTFYLVIYVPYWASCTVKDSKDCNFAYYYLIFTLGNATGYFLHYIFASAVIVSLVGLAYGAEIAYRMTDSWIVRFEDLRRIPMPNSESSGDEEDKNKTRETFSTSTDASLIDISTSINSTTNGVVDKDLFEMLQRDACEHYMFIREYMNQAGQLWSIALVGVFGVFVFIIVAYLYALLVLKEKTMLLRDGVITFIVIRFVVLVIYPIVSLSHANSFCYALQDLFTVAAPKDFEIIGGREMWINFLTSAPAVWTVFGIWVTWDKLVGFLWAVGSTGAAIVITLVSGTDVAGE